MDLDKETKEKIQEIQNYEHALQNILIQKQAFQMELLETENALSEISKSESDIFKMIGNIMIKANKEEVIQDLNRKKEILSLRLKSIEKQEEEITKELDELKKEVLKKIK